MEDLSPCSQGLGRSAVGDRGTVSDLYAIFYLLSSAAEAALADGVREVGSLPSFAVGPKGHRFEGQARFFSSLRKRDDLFGILKNWGSGAKLPK